ncbi:hypothetical protein [Cryptosporangium aurantiacum]|uniref:Uncharacterized protein n=1 Tax=Cryptosporangium aurantiacum TaxID=134849 RepID=A0A1M7HX70_9ACTN|nr:hypothetical protein [Cryptosporangium aurantiacum]SHM32933.1 hypothetical protein SAMN05443668_101317 [Cryptosporangium aurantiacum]
MDETQDREPAVEPVDPVTRLHADGPPPTMPDEARTGYPDAPSPEDYPAPAAKAGGVPHGTAPEVTTAPGTSETMLPVDGVHTPDVGPGGQEFDTDATPLPGRTDHAR